MKAISSLSLEQIGLQKIREMHASSLNADCQGHILIHWITRTHFTLYVYTHVSLPGTSIMCSLTTLRVFDLKLDVILLKSWFKVYNGFLHEY